MKRILNLSRQRKSKFDVLLIGFMLSTYCFSQIDQVKNDTIYVINDVNRPIEFSKALGKFLYIKNMIPDDIPPKSRKLLIISSIGTEVNTKLIQVIDNRHLIIPIQLFTEKYYTLYIGKGNATIIAKKLIIR